MRRTSMLLAQAVLWAAPPTIYASGHGPVFALATPTNPKGGFGFDTSFMGRYGGGNGTMFRGTLGYGITENLKVSASAPLVFKAEPFANSRTAAVTPMEGTSKRSDSGVSSERISKWEGALKRQPSVACSCRVRRPMRDH